MGLQPPPSQTQGEEEEEGDGSTTAITGTGMGTASNSPLAAYSSTWQAAVAFARGQGWVGEARHWAKLAAVGGVVTGEQGGVEVGDIYLYYCVYFYVCGFLFIIIIKQNKIITHTHAHKKYLKKHKNKNNLKN